MTSESKDFYVYAWLRPCGTPFYIGKGSGRRSESFVGRNRVFLRIVEKIRREGREPTTVITHDGLTEEEAFSVEMEQISKIGRIDNGTGSLANMTNGGEGISGFYHSEDTKKKIRDANIGRKKSPEACAKMSRSQTGKTMGEATRAKISAAGIGRVVSPDAREKVGAARRLAPPLIGFKGVSHLVKHGTWRAMCAGTATKHIGVYDTEIEAALAYDAAAYSVWGEDCYLNFPELLLKEAPIGNTKSKSVRRNPPRNRFKGVSFCKLRGRWRANISTDGKNRSIGYFAAETEAARAYDAAAFAAWGAECYLNFPEVFNKLVEQEET